MPFPRRHQDAATRRELLRRDGRAAPHRPSWRNRGCSRWGVLSRVGALRDRGDLAHRRRPKRRTLTAGPSSRSDNPSRSSERDVVREARRTRGGDRAATGYGPGARRRGPADTIQPFPTFSEIYVAALKALRGEIAATSKAVGRQTRARPGT